MAEDGRKDEAAVLHPHETGASVRVCRLVGVLGGPRHFGRSSRVREFGDSRGFDNDRDNGLKHRLPFFRFRNCRCVSWKHHRLFAQPEEVQIVNRCR